jgi:nitric-oxide synthase
MSMCVRLCLHRHDMSLVCIAVPMQQVGRQVERECCVRCTWGLLKCIQKHQVRRWNGVDRYSAAFPSNTRVYSFSSNKRGGVGSSDCSCRSYGGNRSDLDSVGSSNHYHRCYGCGVRLQTDDPSSSGYVPLEKFETKARHKQFDQLLCTRCQDLSHGKMIPGVEDFVQKVETQGFDDESKLITPDQLRRELGHRVKKSRSLVVLLVDLLDFSGSMFGNSIRDLVGGNPIIAVGTKMDLLPESTALHSGGGSGEDAFFDWFENSLIFKKLSVVSMHAVSSKTKQGIDEVVADIKQQRLGRDVYIVGAANVGKSAFVRAFVKEMSSMSSRQFDPLAVEKSKRLPVESSMPGTTLSSIPLDVFQSGGTLYDTPGLHIHHRLPHILTPEENKLLHPRKRIAGFIAPSPRDVRGASDEHACYSWGGLVRLHVISCPEDTVLTFFGPGDVLRVQAKPFSTSLVLKEFMDPDRETKKTAECAAEGEFGAASVSLRGGLRIVKKANVKIPRGDGRQGVADVAISGIPGWVRIDSSGSTRDAVRIVVEAPVGIEAFIRPPMPLT